MIEKWRRMRSEDRRLVLHALLLLVSIRIGLKLFAFTIVRRKLDYWAVKYRQSNSKPLDTNQARRAIEMVGLRILRDGPCLTQALAMQYLMKRSNLPATLCIGVGKGENGRLLAHAWIESDGHVMIGGNGEELRFYSRLLELD